MVHCFATTEAVIALFEVLKSLLTPHDESNLIYTAVVNGRRGKYLANIKSHV